MGGDGEGGALLPGLADDQPVAVHCVTREALVLTIAAIDQAGGVPGDRVEHCAVADHMLAGELARRRLRVVTQPTLMALRGNDYRARVDPRDRTDLWPYARLLKAGVLVAPSSDALLTMPHVTSGDALCAFRVVGCR